MVAKVGLTDARIKSLKSPSQGQAEVSDKIVPGLRIRIGKSGVKTYILRKRVNGKLRNITIGRHTARFGLADARRKARDLLTDIELGKDIDAKVRQVKKDAAGGSTIAELFEVYFNNVVLGKKRSAREMERIFRTHIIPRIGHRIADTITRGDVTNLVEYVTYERGKETPRSGLSVHQQLSAFYSWAMPKLDRLPANPCRDAWRPKPATPRERVLDDDELSALWLTAGSEGEPFGNIVKMLLLTAQRRSEVIEADWSEFDFGDNVWTIPSSRAKNAKVNLVPLSSEAIKVLKEMAALNSNSLSETKGQGNLFPSRSDAPTVVSGISKAWKRMERSVAEMLDREVEHFTIHDLRRTAATGMQRLGIQLVVTEAVLNHQSGSARSGVAGVYHRHHFTAEKREALEEWSQLILNIVETYQSRSD